MSYSGPIRIYQSEHYTLDSYGNGAAYTFACGADSLWLDGDSATQFREELDALEKAFPDSSPLPALWDQYHSE